VIVIEFDASTSHVDSGNVELGNDTLVDTDKKELVEVSLQSGPS